MWERRLKQLMAWELLRGFDVFSDTVKVRLPEKHTLLTYALEEVKVRG